MVLGKTKGGPDWKKPRTFKKRNRKGGLTLLQKLRLRKNPELKKIYGVLEATHRSLPKWAVFNLAKEQLKGSKANKKGVKK